MRRPRFFGTMSGWLFLFLLVGVTGSAALALALADRQRQEDLFRIRFERLIDRMSDFLSVADSVPSPLRQALLQKGVTGIRQATGDERIVKFDEDLSRSLASRLPGKNVDARIARPDTCFRQPAGRLDGEQFECWVVTATLSDGRVIHLQLRGHMKPDRLALNPVVVGVLAVLVATLALVAARMAAAPLGDLARAATALGADLDRRPLPERGPHEVREAARAFNHMQMRLRAYLVERTQLLASITHDLQTPMTRLRLRLEKVSDAALRSRLIDDLGAMQALIREGLDYARSNQTNEPFASLDLDQLLDLVVEDSSEGNAPVRFAHRSDCYVEVRPRALQRCLENLVDNALKYGGSAEISASYAGGRAVITVKDEGPGIPEDKLGEVFEPFVRLQSNEASAAGVGLGLAIAKTLAEKNEAVLSLRNIPGGGLEARLILNRGIERRSGVPRRTPLPENRQPA